MHLFIDTNVFIGFYELSADRLDELEKLITVIKRKDATLWLPDQVRLEFWKNREGSVMKAIKEFENRSILPAVPLLIREDPDFARLSKEIRAAEIFRDELVKKVRSQILEEKTRADVAIRELFAQGSNVNTTDILAAAHERALRRLPPGKEEALGDRLNWVGLLHTLPEGAELHVISDDGDYESEVVKEEIKPFLAKEWQKKKKGSVILWKRLSKYLAAHFPEAQNAIEMERAIVAQHLQEASSFAAAHAAIAELRKFETFSAEHAQIIANALMSNSQIRWISSDRDINEFVRQFLKSNAKHIGPEDAAKIRKYYDIEGPPDIPSPDA